MRPGAAPDHQQPSVRAASQPSLARNATWQLAATVARAAIGLLSVPIYTRLLGMPQWGLLALFQAAIAPLVLVDALGTATVKFVSVAAARGDDAEVERVFHTTLLFNLAVGAAGVVALVASSRWLATSAFAIPPQDVSTAIVGFRVIAVNWGISIVTAAYVAVLVAHQQYASTSRLSVLSALLSVGLGLGVAAVGGDIIAVLVAQTVAGLVMAGLYFRSALRFVPGVAARPRWNGAAFRRSFSFGLWQFLTTAGVLLTTSADRYILGAYFVPAMVGVYAVANLLFAQLHTAFFELGEMLFPAVSHLEARGDLPAARRLALLVGWTLTTAFGVCAAVLAIVGGDFLQLWISPEAGREAQTALRLMCIGGIAGIAAIAPFNYVLGVGNSRWDGISFLSSGLVVVVVGVLLVPRHGLPAVGYGLIAGALLRWVFVALVWRAYFAAGVGAASFAAHVWSPPVLSVAAILALSALHDRMARPVTWPWLFVEGGVTLALVVAIQLGASELLPGGAERRRDVLFSFKPLLERLFRAPR
jgi:O-antigen/teichoic acid export membrane protein